MSGSKPLEGEVDPKTLRDSVPGSTLAHAFQGMLPHEFLANVASGVAEYEDEVIIRGVLVKFKRKPTFNQRIMAANAAAPYFASKLVPKLPEGSTPEDDATALRAFYHAAAAATRGSDDE